MDPEYWKNPEQFIPERWLDGAGDLSPELDAYYPFSAGYMCKYQYLTLLLLIHLNVL